MAVPAGLRRGACVLQMGLITLLSLLPSQLFPPSPVHVPGMDKWIHVAMYGLWGALLRWAAVQEGEIPPTRRWWPWAAAGYGLLMEFLQFGLCGGTRMFSWGDAAANLAGALLFWMVAGQWLGKRPPPET